MEEKKNSRANNNSVYAYFYLELYIFNWLISLVDRVFANDLGDLGSIPGLAIP